MDTMATMAVADELPMDAHSPGRVETATFGLGCFWQPDAEFGVIPGVVRTRVGYAGGSTDAPTYRDIGDHTEVVQIDYDPDQITYDALLDVFWNRHNPRIQSPTTQYQNVAFYHTSDQRESIEESRDRVVGDQGPVKTRVEAFERFHLAEHYHQKYRLRRVPLLVSFLATVYDDDQLVNSTVAARLNGYVAGYGRSGQLRDELGEFGLSPTAEDVLLDIVE